MRLGLRLAIVISGVLHYACSTTAWALPSYQEIKHDYASSETIVLDRYGQQIHRLRTDSTVRRGRWMSLSEVSPALRLALVMSEDKRFYEHSGVDWQAVSSAAWANLWNKNTRGASTITMQLAGLIDPDLKARRQGRSLVQKLGQAVNAEMLERNWKKDQILEAYLNLVPFRGEIVGVDALSHTLFGKAPHGLDQTEAAIAAALLRAPNAKPLSVSRRACGILQLINKNKDDCAWLDVVTEVALQSRAFEPSEGIAPHYARQLVHSASVMPSGNSAIHTSLDGRLQQFALQTLRQQLMELRGRNVEDGAIVVLDNKTGAVLAWVGSSGDLSRANQVDAVLALRQAGSTLKPFLYAQAISEKRLTAASLLEDSPAQIYTGNGLYIPQNYDKQFKGWVSVRAALASSLNVPAVRTLVMVSPNAFHTTLKALGLPVKETGDYYGYSLALGSAEVSLLSLTNAYRALANGGMYSPPRVGTINQKSNSAAVQKVSTSVSVEPMFTHVIDPKAAFIISDILSDSNARALTFGLHSVLNTRAWTAVKTGTSKDMRDNWAIGYSRDYTVGVWVGNAHGSSMWSVSGTTGAAPVWAAMMKYLHTQRRSAPPIAPSGVSTQIVSFSKGGEPPRSEWFIHGSEQTQFALSKEIAYTGKQQLKDTLRSEKIISPVNGTIIALDPDIPIVKQVLSLKASGNNVYWLLDGKKIAQSKEAQWQPTPGKHELTLVNTYGEVQDKVSLTVRGLSFGVVAPRTSAYAF
jgi:penicillin-binding protein 1C